MSALLLVPLFLRLDHDTRVWTSWTEGWPRGGQMQWRRGSGCDKSLDIPAGIAVLQRGVEREDRDEVRGQNTGSRPVLLEALRSMRILNVTLPGCYKGIFTYVG